MSLRNEEECFFTCEVPLSREDAFELFVGRLTDWWPRGYSFFGEDMLEVGVEPRLGGLCYEISKTGNQVVWGTVLSIEAPLYVRLAWQIGPDRSVTGDPGAASRVMVTFREARHGTNVELVHNDFLRHGEGGLDYLKAMASPQGWPDYLARFVDASRS